jgi:hypothetical protein
MLPFLLPASPFRFHTFIHCYMCIPLVTCQRMQVRLWYSHGQRLLHSVTRWVSRSVRATGQARFLQSLQYHLPLGLFSSVRPTQPK